MKPVVNFRTHVDRLQFRFPFHIAHGVRTGTDAVFLIAEVDGCIGIGEATLPPYLNDTVESSLSFFKSQVVNSITWPFHPAEVFHQVNSAISGNMPAKAALDMALWQIYVRKKEITFDQALGLKPPTWPVPHCFTIDVSDTDLLIRKFNFAREQGFEFFKLKLDGVTDLQMINDYRNISDFPFAVDANQSWKDLNKAIDFTMTLKQNGCQFIEQPFEKSDLEMTGNLCRETDMIIMADEALQTAEDFDRVCSAFNAINLKLQKCGGPSAALTLIQKANAFDIPVMVGCMSESSVGCGAGEWIAPACQWADLDGPFLITNDEEIREKLNSLSEEMLRKN